MANTPTQRTIKALKEQGHICGIVEKFNRFVGPHGIRQDLFGFIDIISIDPIDGIIGIQSCGQDFSGHVKKILNELNESNYEALIAWLKFSKLHLYGWRKVKLKRGSKAMRWKPRIGIFELKDDQVTFREIKD
jgi:hypothetical protein